MRGMCMLTCSRSVIHQSEDGETASASKLELAATPAHVRDDCILSSNLLRKLYIDRGSRLYPRGGRRSQFTRLAL